MITRINSVQFPQVFLRMDGSAVHTFAGAGGGTVNGQFGIPGSFEEFRISGVDTVTIESVQFPNVFLRMDGSGVTAFSGSGGGTVNCQFGAGGFEKFRVFSHPGGNKSIESVQFPNVFLRLDPTGVNSSSGGGVGGVNCQLGAGAFEMFQFLEIEKNPELDGMPDPNPHEDQGGHEPIHHEGDIEGNEEGSEGGACFAGDIPVATEYGPVEIRRISVGQPVPSFDEVSGSISSGRVKRIFQHKAELMLEVSAEGLAAPLRVTPHHRFRVDDRWVAAGQLHPGMRLHRLVAGTLVPCLVTNIRPAGYGEVFNLEIEPTHTYFVGGILVHNVKTKAGTQTGGASQPTKSS